MAETSTEPLRNRHNELRPHIEQMGAIARLVPELDPAARLAALQPVLEFLRGDLWRHAEAEERWLYPEIAHRLRHPLATATMKLDHTILRESIAELATQNGRDADALQRTLYGVEALLLAHLRKEEELYLPQLEHKTDEATVESIEEAMARYEAGRPELKTVEQIDLDRDEFPFTGSELSRLVFLLRYAVRAPSSHNSQPWRVRAEDDSLLVYADRTRAVPVADPDDRELEISCGAFLHHLRLAITHHGHEDDVVLLPDPDDDDLLARVKLGAERPPSYDERLLFWATAKRHTTRRPFLADELPDDLLGELVDAAGSEGAWLTFLDGDARVELASLVAEGDRLQMRDPSFRRELASWVHGSRNSSSDGMPREALGLPKRMTPGSRLAIRTVDLGKGAAAHDAKLIEASPLLAVLGTAGDTTRDRLAAGQALSHVLLRAAQDGVSASFLNQPVEVDDLRPRLSELAGSRGMPQLVLRLGRGPAVRQTPRRPVREILVS
ncbi:MAG TPA: hemerythrin domain-containing protein [Gaiellaceae bacterium]|nr:hemerythrin domain-containing protein [Gaiellaceae bacterium]